MKEYLIYLAVMSLAADLVILCACFIPGRFSGKTGYGWRKILWVVVAVRLLIPVQTISSMAPVSFVPFHIPIAVSGEEASSRSEENVEGEPEAELSGTDDARQPEQEAQLDDTLRSEHATQSDDTLQSGHAMQSGNTLQPGQGAQTGNSAQSGSSEEETSGGTAGKDAVPDRGSGNLSLVSRAAEVDWHFLFLFVWLTGAAGILGIRSVQYQILKKKAAGSSVPCRDAGIKAMIRSICEEQSVKGKISVRLSREIKTPMLFGYYRPVIILPHRKYHEDEAEMILRHEIQHFKNRDLWYKFLIMFVCDLYWFNPILRFMKKAAYQDIECICDEKVVRELDLKGKKIYASTILETAARGKSEVVFGTHFSRGKRSVEVRIRNIFTRKNKWGYVFFAFLAVAVIGGTCLWNVRENESSQTQDGSLAAGDPDREAGDQGEENQEIPVFDVDSVEELERPGDYRLEDYYITNRTAAGNRFYIDSGSVLWGYGSNDYGQLGNGQRDELGVFYSEPIRIASDVVSVDMSMNGYFCIYLTSDGKLYGMGADADHILGEDAAAENAPMVMIASETFPVVTEPVLIEEDVVYARAGMQCIVYLKNDGSVWWQGRYEGTYHSGIVESPSWARGWDAEDPFRMRADSPQKLLDDCIYVTTGNNTGAAITREGELYTWGRNLMGECGTPVTGEDFVRKPVKVLDDVQMVWVDRMCFNSPEQEIPERWHYNTRYEFNTFVKMKDGTLMASGKGVGGKETKTSITGDLDHEQTHYYSDTFVPIRVRKYSEAADRQSLCKLEWGMRGEEVCRVLDEAWLQYSITYAEYPNPLVTDGEQVRSIMVEGKYFLYFDGDERLYQIHLQEGGSRDQRFSVGMTREEVEELTGPLVYTQEEGRLSWAEKPENGNYYGFFFYDGKVTGILESGEKPVFVGEPTDW